MPVRHAQLQAAAAGVRRSRGSRVLHHDCVRECASGCPTLGRVGRSRGPCTPIVNARQDTSSKKMSAGQARPDERCTRTVDSVGGVSASTRALQRLCGRGQVTSSLAGVDQVGGLDQ